MKDIRKKTVATVSILLFPLLLSGCFGGTKPPVADTAPGNPVSVATPAAGTPTAVPAESGDTDWKYDKAIPQALATKVSTGSDVVLGDLEKYQATVSLPKNTFDTETQVDIKTPDSVPKYLGKEVKMLGSPLEITADAKQRLNEPVTVTFKYDKNAIDPVRGTSSLRVTYYDGTKWAYIKPDSVNAEKGTITFTTYHFSLF
jgi:hypothetical protein